VTMAYTAKSRCPRGRRPVPDREGPILGRVVPRRAGDRRPIRGTFNLVRCGRRARLTADALLPDGTFLSAAKVGVTLTDPAGQQHLDGAAAGRSRSLSGGHRAGLARSLRVRAAARRTAGRVCRTPSLGAGLCRRACCSRRPTNRCCVKHACSSGGRYDPQVEDLFAVDGRSATRALPLWRATSSWRRSLRLCWGPFGGGSTERYLMSDIAGLQTEFFSRLRPIRRRLRARQALSAIEARLPLGHAGRHRVFVRCASPPVSVGLDRRRGGLAPLLLAVVWRLTRPIGLDRGGAGSRPAHALAESNPCRRWPTFGS